MKNPRQRTTTSSSRTGGSNGLFGIFGLMILIGCCNILLFHKFQAEDLKGVIGHHTGLDPNNKSASYTNGAPPGLQSQGEKIPVVDIVQKKDNNPSKDVKDEQIKNKSVTNQDAGSDSLSLGSHETAGLSCSDHGGPSDELAEEMIFWSDIPSDSEYKSPFYDEEKYITFEPDKGGWNNIRMAYETILVLAHATGRTLVLPPEQRMYLLGKGDSKHKKEFSFNDFFHLDSIATEHAGLNIITMEEFLERKGKTGQLKDRSTGEILKPSKTNWNGEHLDELFKYLRAVGKYPEGWNPSKCFAAIPQSTDPKHIDELQSMFDDIIAGKHGEFPNPEKDFVDDPVPVGAPAVARMREMLAGRKEICIYDAELQAETVLHFKVDHREKARMLTHFYAFIFFQDWVSSVCYRILTLTSYQESHPDYFCSFYPYVITHSSPVILKFSRMKIKYRNKIRGASVSYVITFATLMKLYVRQLESSMPSAREHANTHRTMSRESMIVSTSDEVTSNTKVSKSMLMNCTKLVRINSKRVDHCTLPPMRGIRLFSTPSRISTMLVS